MFFNNKKINNKGRNKHNLIKGKTGLSYVEYIGDVLKQNEKVF